MSKSKGNMIDIFLSDKDLRKQIMKIETDSTPLEDPKNPEICNLFAIYKLVATKSQTEEMYSKYLAGNYGYGHAKQAFFELIVEKYKTERDLYHYYVNNTDEIEKVLKIGAQKARIVAQEVLQRCRKKIGY